MKIAFVATPYLDPNTSSSWSGLPHFMRQSIEQAGVEVDTWVLGEPRRASRLIRYAYWRLLRRRRYLRSCDTQTLLRHAAEIERRLRAAPADALFCPSSWPASYYRGATPAVFWTDATFAGMLDFYDSFRRLAPTSLAEGNAAEQAALDRCARAIYSSEWAAASAQRHYRADPEKLRVVPFGGNVAGRPSLAEVQDFVGRRDDRECRLLLIGVDWKRKGADVAVEAVNCLNRRGRPARLTILGCTPPPGASLPPYVDAIPFIDKTSSEGRRRFQALCRDSHFLLAPSQADCTPVVVAEGNYFGLPCLAAKVGGMASIVADDVNGRCFDLQAGGEAYADYIQEKMRQPERYRELAVSCASFAERHLSWESAGAKVAAIIEEAVAEGGEPPAPARKPKPPPPAPRFFGRSIERFRRFSPRARAVGLFFVSSICARGVGALCQIVQVPIAIRALGNEAFGLWISLMSISYLITFADFGLGQGTQNKMAEAFATERKDLQQSLFVNAFLVLSLVGGALYLAGSVALPWINFTHLFRIRSPAVQAAAPGAVHAVLLFFCANFPLALAQRLSYARQKGWLNNLTQASVSVAAVVGIAVAAALGAGLVGIVTVVQASIVAGNAVLLIYHFWDLGWIGRLRLRIHVETVRDLLSLGGFFALQQVLTVVLFALPQIVISTALGAASVTSYNLAQRFFNVFGIVQGAFMLPLWPAYSDAVGRSEFGWIRRTLGKSLKATAFFTVLPMAVATFGAHRLIGLWVGHRADLPTAGLIWILFAWNTAVFFQQPFGFLLAGISEVKRMTYYAIVGTIASTVLMFCFVHSMGQTGVVVGLLAGFVPFYFVGAVWQSVQALRAMHRSGAAAPHDHALARQAS